MKIKLLLLLIALVSLALVAPHSTTAATAPPATGQFAYFYKPPTDGTSTANIAALNRYVILTHGDESYRSSLKSAGYTGPVLQYLGASEIEGPGPYANSSAACDSGFQPYHNQVAMDAGDFCTYLHPNESYFLHNASGQRLYENDGGGHYTYHMNPAAPGFRNFFVQRAVREKQTMGYDGLFLDNVWVTLWSVMNRMVVNANGAQYPQEFPSDAAYRSAYVGLLSELRGAVGSWLILGNLASDDYNATTWDPFMAYLDGGMDEAFGAGWPSGGYPSTTEWLTDLAKAERVAGQGKIFLAVAQGNQGDTTRMRFAYGSYLLTMQADKSFYRYALADSGYSYQWTYNDFWTDIGTPSGGRVEQADGTWRRNFTKGYVVVNPSTHAVQIVQRTFAPGMAPPNKYNAWLPNIIR